MIRSGLMRTAEHGRAYRAVASEHASRARSGLSDGREQWRAYNCAGTWATGFRSVVTWLARRCGPVASMGFGGPARPLRGAEKHDDNR